MSMLKGGVFIDVENINRTGGWGMRYDVLQKLVGAQDVLVLRANAYIAVDEDRESRDPEYRRKREEYRNAMRRAGMHLVSKKVQRYRNENEELILKANADLDLAVDALLQAENLDYVLICSGDGDFLRLVRALQNRGKRVDVLSFSNTSTALRHEADYYFSGYLVPGLIPTSAEHSGRVLGTMHGVNEEKGFGFITVRTGLGFTQVRDDVFCHISDFTTEKGEEVSNEYFASLKTREAIIEFDLVEQDDGRVKAVNATEFAPVHHNGTGSA